MPYLMTAIQLAMHIAYTYGMIRFLAHMNNVRPIPFKYVFIFVCAVYMSVTYVFTHH